MERIRQLRQERDLSQAKLAVMAGMDPATLNRLEQGKGNPSLRTLQQVADVLGVGVADLLETDSPKGQAPPPPEEAGRSSVAIARWADLLNHVGGMLQDIEGTYGLHKDNFIQMSTLFFTVMSLYRLENPKAGATPSHIAVLEEAEGVLRLGLQMFERRAEEEGADLVQIAEYREAKAALQGAA